MRVVGNRLADQPLALFKVISAAVIGAELCERLHIQGFSFTEAFCRVKGSDGGYLLSKRRELFLAIF